MGMAPTWKRTPPAGVKKGGGNRRHLRGRDWAGGERWTVRAQVGYRHRVPVAVGEPDSVGGATACLRTLSFCRSGWPSSKSQ